MRIMKSCAQKSTHTLKNFCNWQSHSPSPPADLCAFCSQKLRKSHIQGFAFVQLVVIKINKRISLAGIHNVSVAATIIRKWKEPLGARPDNGHVFIPDLHKISDEECFGK